MPSKYSIGASNNPRIVDTNPRKNRIIHEISTNPEWTPLRTCFSWLHLFLGSLRSLLSDENCTSGDLHGLQGLAIEATRWISHVKNHQQINPSLFFCMIFLHLVTGCQRSTENQHKLIHHNCSNTDVLCSVFVSLFAFSSGYPLYLNTWMW